MRTYALLWVSSFLGVTGRWAQIYCCHSWLVACVHWCFQCLSVVGV
jgi:hypothetical protein